MGPRPSRQCQGRNSGEFEVRRSAFGVSLRLSLAQVSLSMREREPSAQLLRGLVRRIPVERHECRRSAGQARDLGPPLAEPDAGDFDVILATIDDFVESMNVHGAAADRK